MSLDSAGAEPVEVRDAGASTAVVSFSDLFSAALRGAETVVEAADGSVEALPVHRWRRPADRADRALLGHCAGPTLDVGCGPGRMAAALAARGVPVLGIDVVAEAVQQTRRRGVEALQCDVFSPALDERRWGTALLADGNVGIGGDPLALLRRARSLLDPGGRVVVELDPPGSGWASQWSWLRTDGARSKPFRWARVGVDAVHDLARRAGLQVGLTDCVAGRWVAVLHRS